MDADGAAFKVRHIHSDVVVGMLHFVGTLHRSRRMVGLLALALAQFVMQKRALSRGSSPRRGDSAATRPFNPASSPGSITRYPLHIGDQAARFPLHPQANSSATLFVRPPFQRHETAALSNLTLQPPSVT